MTLPIATVAIDQDVQRVVFATSNHVMGRYKDSPLWEQVGPNEPTPELPPGTGTVWHTGLQPMDATAYAAAKLMGERVYKEAALRATGKTTFACIRIGWCQPGENLPATLSAAGTPTQSSGGDANADAALQRADRWCKEMWLSNRDFTQIFERAILSEGSSWPHGSSSSMGCPPMMI